MVDNTSNTENLEAAVDTVLHKIIFNNSVESSGQSWDSAWSKRGNKRNRDEHGEPGSGQGGGSRIGTAGNQRFREVKVRFRQGKEVNAIISEEGNTFFIYGRTQSGKTLETLKRLTAKMISEQCAGIYICQPLKMQGCAQYKSFLERLACLGLTYKIDVRLVVNDLGKDGKKSLTDEFSNMDFAEDMIAGFGVREVNKNTKKPLGNVPGVAEAMMWEFPEDGTIPLYVVMGNYSSYNKIINGIQDGAKIKYCVAVDEADVFVKDEYNRQDNGDLFKDALLTLIDGSIGRFFVTATPLDSTNFTNDEERVSIIWTDHAQVDELEGSDKVYRSLHKMEHHPLVYDDTTRIGNLKQAIAVVKECINNKYYEPYNQKRMSFLICHFASTQNKTNRWLAKQISRLGKYVGGTFASEIPVLVSDQKGTFVYLNGRAKKKFETIADGVSFMKNCGPIMYMMGTNLTSRATRVTCAQYHQYIGGLVYNMGDIVCASLLVQRIGRAMGLSDRSDICKQYIWASRQNWDRACEVTDASTKLMQEMRDGYYQGATMGTVMENYTQPARFSRGKICNIKRINKADVDMRYRSCHKAQAAVAVDPETPSPPHGLKKKDLYSVTKDEEDGCFKKYTVLDFTKLNDTLLRRAIEHMYYSLDKIMEKDKTDTVEMSVKKINEKFLCKWYLSQTKNAITSPLKDRVHGAIWTPIRNSNFFDGSNEAVPNFINYYTSNCGNIGIIYKKS